jgi:hypothetical protein
VIHKLGMSTTPELRTPNGVAHALAAARPCSNRDSRVLGTRRRVKEVCSCEARSALASSMYSPRPGMCKPSRTHREND